VVRKSSEGVEERRESVQECERGRVGRDLAGIGCSHDPALGFASEGARDIEERRELGAAGDEERLDRRQLLLDPIDPGLHLGHFGLADPLVCASDLGLHGEQALLDPEEYSVRLGAIHGPIHTGRAYLHET